MTTVREELDIGETATTVVPPLSTALLSVISVTRGHSLSGSRLSSF